MTHTFTLDGQKYSVEIPNDDLPSQIPQQCADSIAHTDRKLASFHAGLMSRLESVAVSSIKKNKTCYWRGMPLVVTKVEEPKPVGTTAAPMPATAGTAPGTTAPAES